MGYDGARVIRIAERAGVTHQLITYHFGGKRGLFDALSECWVASSRVLVEGDESLVDVVGALVRQAGTESDWNRALVYTAGKGTDGSRFTMNLEPLLENARKRQARGDFPADLDPGIFSLVLIAANMAPISISHVARARSPVDLSDPAFVEYYAEQLGRLLCHLRHSGVSSRDVE